MGLFYLITNQRKEVYVPEVKRKKGESFEGLFRQYTRKLRESGRLVEARKRRAYKPAANTLAKKKAAARRKKINHKLDYLRKIGKIHDRTPQDEIKKYIKKIK